MAEEETMTTASAARKTPPGGLWYRYRYLVIGLLTANAGMAAYWLLTREPPKVTVKLPSSSPQEIHKPEAEPKAEALPVKEAITVPPVASSQDTPAASPDMVAVPGPPEKAREEIKQEVSQAVAKVEAKLEKPVSKNEQIEVYKWMLSEKRKVKPSSSEEKARIDLEKAILKDYIRGKAPLL